MKTTRNAKALYHTARECVERFDYEQAISLIEAIPEDERTTMMSDLLATSQAKQAQVDFLIQEIDDLSLQDTREVEMIQRLRELLELKPGLENYRARLSQLTEEGDEWDDEQITLSKTDSQVQENRESVVELFGIPPLILGVAVITTVIFGGFMLWLYQALSDDRISVQVKIDDEQAFVIFDGDPTKRASHGRKIRLSEGSHKYEVHNDAGRLIGPLRFEVKVDGNQQLIVRLKAERRRGTARDPSSRTDVGPKVFEDLDWGRHRAVAEWALSVGSSIRVEGNSQLQVIDQLAKLPEGEFRLQAIDFSHASLLDSLSRDDFQRLEAFAGLQELNLSGISNLDPQIVRVLTTLPDFEILELRETEIDGPTLAELQSLTSLDWLDVADSSLTQVEGELLKEALADSSVAVTADESVAFRYLAPHGNAQLVLRVASGMVLLATHRDQIPDEGFQTIGLTLVDESTIGEEFAREVSKTMVENLNLSGCRQFNDQALVVLSETLQLIEINVNRTACTANGVLEFLRSHPGCVVVHSSYEELIETRRDLAGSLLDEGAVLTLIHEGGESIVDPLIVFALPEDPFLIQGVSFESQSVKARIADGLLNSVCSLRELKGLNLNGRENVVATLLAEMKKLPHLEELQLANTSLSDNQLSRIGKSLPALRWLNVTDSNVTPMGVTAFQEIRPQVRVTPTTDSVLLHLLLSGIDTHWSAEIMFRDQSRRPVSPDDTWPEKEFRVITLDLTDHQGETDRLLSIAAGSYLEELTLGGSQVTDAGFRSLAASKALKEIDVTGTLISAAAIDEVRDAVSSVKITSTP